MAHAITFVVAAWFGRHSAVLRAACLATVVAVGQDHPATPHQHTEGQQLQNPIATSPASLAAGSKLYTRYCANCHGTTGRGNGRLAAGTAMYGKRPSDLTDDEWQHGSSDGEIFLVVRDGIGPEFQMDAFGRMMSDEEIWMVVNYVKTLSIRK